MATRRLDLVPGADLVVAVPAALLGSAGFGLATAMQQRATQQVAPGPRLSPRLVLDLLAHRSWLAGVALTVGALALQIVALASGPIAVVQPLLVTGVVFAATFAALLGGRHPDRVVVLGGLLCTLGLGAFLALARPTPRGTGVDGGPAVALAVVVAAGVAACLVHAAGTRRSSRVLSLALATGLLFGTGAALMKIVTEELAAGPLAPLTHPVLYVSTVVGTVGFVLSQHTFQQGRRVAPAVAIITSVDPVVGVLAGIAWLGEGLDPSPGRLAGALAAAAVAVTGIVVITRRSSAVC